MKIFARPEIVGGNSDVDKQLMKLKAPSLISLATFYQKIFSVDKEQIEIKKQKKEDNIESLEGTQVFLKVLYNNYQQLKKQVFGMI